MLAEEAQERATRARDRHPARPRLGDLVIEAKGLRKAFGDKLLIDEPQLQAAALGGIVGVIGPNGAGKTTLFRMITGQEQPDAASW
jgi:energy-dependent translational throttle protein EttA